MNTVIGQTPWTAKTLANPPRSGAVLCMTESDWYHHPEQRSQRESKRRMLNAYST